MYIIRWKMINHSGKLQETTKTCFYKLGFLHDIRFSSLSLLFSSIFGLYFCYAVLYRFLFILLWLFFCFFACFLWVFVDIFFFHQLLFFGFSFSRQSELIDGETIFYFLPFLLFLLVLPHAVSFGSLCLFLQAWNISTFTYLRKHYHNSILRNSFFLFYFLLLFGVCVCINVSKSNGSDIIFHSIDENMLYRSLIFLLFRSKTFFFVFFLVLYSKFLNHTYIPFASFFVYA